MEQYYLPKKLDFKNLRFCLNNYLTDFIYIQGCGDNPNGSYSMQGRSKVNENLINRKLDFKKIHWDYIFLQIQKKVFHFPLGKYYDDYQKGFSLAYERIIPTKDGIGKLVMLSTGIDPYDPKLPEPRRSFLRNVIDGHLIEIFFKGRVNLKFHSWWKKPHWKYWTIDKS